MRGSADQWSWVPAFAARVPAIRWSALTLFKPTKSQVSGKFDSWVDSDHTMGPTALRKYRGPSAPKTSKSRECATLGARCAASRSPQGESQPWEGLDSLNLKARMSQVSGKNKFWVNFDMMMGWEPSLTLIAFGRRIGRLSRSCGAVGPAELRPGLRNASPGRWKV